MVVVLLVVCVCAQEVVDARRRKGYLRNDSLNQSSVEKEDSLDAEHLRAMIYETMKQVSSEEREFLLHHSQPASTCPGCPPFPTGGGGGGGGSDGSFLNAMNARKKMDEHRVGGVAGQGVNGKTPIVFVTGPESSGNRYTVKMLIEAARCHGKSGHSQPLDHKAKGRNKDWSILDKNVLRTAKSRACVVLHRSFPHNHHFADLTKMSRIARAQGFVPQVIVLVRFMPAVIDSQVTRKHVPNPLRGRSNTRRAYLEIFKDIVDAELPFTLVVYEFLKEPNYVKWLFDEIGLVYNPTAVPVFKEENDKHNKDKN
jgi:hypothetical protein